MKAKQAFILVLLALSTLNNQTAHAQGTAFTYQGQLNSSSSPANGNYDFTFALFNNSSTNTGQVGDTLTNLDVGVNNGLFTVTLNFGAVFTGNATWLAIGVRTNGSTNFTALNPLQEMTPVPYAIYATTAGSAASANSVAATNIRGTIPSAILTSVPAASLTGTVSAAQLPAAVVMNNETGVTLSGNITNTTPQTVQRGVGSFVQGLQSLGLWTNLVESAWFSPGQNYVSPHQSNGTCNLIGIVQNSDATNANGTYPNVGLAVNCTQVNSGLLYSGTGSSIVFSNLPTILNSGMTLMVFYTQEGSVQTIVGKYPVGGFYNTTDTQGLCFQAVTSGYNTYLNANDGTNNYYLNSIGPDYSDSNPHCVVIATDRTNLYQYTWTGNFTPGYSPWSTASLNEEAVGPPVNEIALGTVATHQTQFYAANSIVCGFVAFSNNLSFAQVQQVFALAANTVLPWRRVICEGDSLAYYIINRGDNLETNSAFWGNSTYTTTALAGASIEQIINRFYPITFTNFPNGQDIIFPSTEIFWGGQNSFGADTAAQVESDILWEVQAVHASGGKIYVETPTESATVTTTNAIELKRVAVELWELAGSSGADGIIDSDTMFYNLLGTNYYTNTTYFADGVHPAAYGYSLICTNINGVIGTNLLTPSLFINYPLQPIVASSTISVPAANLTGTVSAAQLPASVVMNNTTGVALSGTFSGNGNFTSGSFYAGNQLPGPFTSQNVQGNVIGAYPVAWVGYSPPNPIQITILTNVTTGVQELAFLYSTNNTCVGIWNQQRILLISNITGFPTVTSNTFPVTSYPGTTGTAGACLYNGSVKALVNSGCDSSFGFDTNTTLYSLDSTTFASNGVALTLTLPNGWTNCQNGLAPDGQSGWYVIVQTGQYTNGITPGNCVVHYNSTGNYLGFVLLSQPIYNAQGIALNSDGNYYICGDDASFLTPDAGGPATFKMTPPINGISLITETSKSSSVASIVPTSVSFPFAAPSNYIACVAWWTNMGQAAVAYIDLSGTNAALYTTANGYVGVNNLLIGNGGGGFIGLGNGQVTAVPGNGNGFCVGNSAGQGPVIYQNGFIGNAYGGISFPYNDVSMSAGATINGLTVDTGLINYGTYTGSLAGGTSIPAGQLTGQIPQAALPSGVLTNNETGVTLNGTFTGTFNGNDAALKVAAADITGTISTAQLPTEVVEALKEQQNEINEKSAEIEELKAKSAKVDVLEKQLNELKLTVQSLTEKK